MTGQENLQKKSNYTDYIKGVIDLNKIDTIVYIIYSHFLSRTLLRIMKTE